MSDFEEHVVGFGLDDNELPEVQPDAEDQNENKLSCELVDEELTTVLVAYNLRTGEALYEQRFETNQAKRILAIQNSGWKQKKSII